LQEKNHPTNRF